MDSHSIRLHRGRTTTISSRINSFLFLLGMDLTCLWLFDAKKGKKGKWISHVASVHHYKHRRIIIDKHFSPYLIWLKSSKQDQVSVLLIAHVARPWQLHSRNSTRCILSIGQQMLVSSPSRLDERTAVEHMPLIHMMMLWYHNAIFNHWYICLAICCSSSPTTRQRNSSNYMYCGCFPIVSYPYYH